MIKIGKTRRQELRLDELMRSAHTLSISVRLLTLDHVYKKDLTPFFADGQVSVDADAEVTRSLDLTLLDPQGRVQIEPDEPGKTSVYVSDMISVIYVVQNPERTETYEIPVFCGPVDAVSRSGPFLDVKALGKESLSLTNLWFGRTFKKGQRKTNVIRWVMKNLAGEMKLSVPDLATKMPNDRVLDRDDVPWKVVYGLARSMGYQLFYDGRGIMQMRKRLSTPVLRLDDTWLESEPDVSYDLEEVINAVDVIGGKPKKAKKKVSARAVAQRNHALSPWRLGRGGIPRYLFEEIEDDSLRSKVECRRLADRTLKRGLMAGAEISAVGIPHPRLEELDVISIRTEEVSMNIVLRKFTIPLVAGEQASYGFLKSFKPRGGARILKARHVKHGGRRRKNGPQLKSRVVGRPQLRSQIVRSRKG